MAEYTGTVSFGKETKGKRAAGHHGRGGREPRGTDSEVAAPERLRGRAGGARRSHRRRRAEPARHSATAGCGAAGGVPGQGNPGRLPPAGCEDQRQTHRGHHPADAPQGARDGCPASRLILRGEQIDKARFHRSRQSNSPYRARKPMVHRAGAAGYHESLAGDRILYFGGLVPGDHPRAHRGRRSRPEGRAQGPEGKRHRGPADSRPVQVSRTMPSAGAHGSRTWRSSCRSSSSTGSSQPPPPTQRPGPGATTKRRATRKRPATLRTGITGRPARPGACLTGWRPRQYNARP